MSKRKLADYFNPGNNTNVREDVDSTVQNQPIIETTTSQDKEALTIGEDKPFHRSHDFCFPKSKFGERQRPCQTHWFRIAFALMRPYGAIQMSSRSEFFKTIL